MVSANKIDAYSMVPGILMATYCALYSPIEIEKWCTFVVYIVMCMVSMRYHLKKNDPYCDRSSLQRYFKHDMLAQQLSLCSIVVHAPSGGAMVLLLMPLATLIAVTNADMTIENNQSVLAYGACFMNCILSALALNYNQRLRMIAEMCGVYIIFNIDKFYFKNKYTHGVFHLMVHYIAYTSWSLLGII